MNQLNSDSGYTVPPLLTPTLERLSTGIPRRRAIRRRLQRALEQYVRALVDDKGEDKAESSRGAALYGAKAIA